MNPYDPINGCDPETGYVPHWSDDFSITQSQAKEIKELQHDLLRQAAYICNLNTDDWDADDFDIFRDIITYQLPTS